MSIPLLQLTDISKSFGAVRALSGVSFDLHAGEVHALLGENGAGKTTLIKIMTGAYQPDGGVIDLAGERIAHLTPASAHKLGIACIYQQPALFPDLSVAENVGLRLERSGPLRRIGWVERRKRAAALLHRIGADISPEAETRHLSMPEQQLVEIACALGAGTRIVIMDEPTASLTQKEQHLLFSIVGELRKSGVGIIYISHRLEEIFALADRVTVLRDGESVGTRHVRTSRVAETPEVAAQSSNLPSLTESELIQMMVGREVPELYPSMAAIVESSPAETPAKLSVEFTRLGNGPRTPRPHVDAAGVRADEASALLHEFPLAKPVPGRVVLALKEINCAAGGIRNISLEVRAGEIVGLAGLVGAGRTELARVLFGLTPADSGEVMLNGLLVTIASPREAVAHGLAYMPEDRRQHGVVLEMPITANVTMAIHRRIFPGSWLRFDAERELALHYIQALDIHTSGPEAPGASLSGGNQQKVALARWLATEPKVLILDEPTQGVDVGAKSEIHKIIRSLAKRGLAVLMISSDLPEVIGMSDRIAVMRGGEIVALLPGKSDPQLVMAAALGAPGNDQGPNDPKTQ